MLLLLAAACADIAFTLGESARATAAETGADTAATGDTGADSAGDTGTDTGTGTDTAPDTSSDTAADTGDAGTPPLASIYDMGDVVAVPTVGYADWISPGDVNGDGYTDLVASIYNAGSWTAGNLSHDFELVLSDGTGGYSVTYVPIGLLGDNPMPTVVGDFDGDGLGDLAVVSPSGLTLFRYDGKTLVDRVDFTVGATRVIRAADVDSDGDLDLVGLKSDEAVVWANDGAGGFTELGRVATLNGTASVADQNKLHLYDIDSDGILDLYTNGDQWYGVPTQVNLGVGDGTFGAAITSFPDAPYMLDAFVGDYDGDGTNEVAFLDAWYLHLSIGEWTGTVSAPVTYTPTLYGFSWVVPADTDGDGGADLIGIDGFHAQVFTRTAKGMAYLPSFPVINYELLGAVGCQVFVVGDANDDDCDDLFTYDFPEGYRLSLSRAEGCAGVREADTGGETSADTGAETSGETADTGGADTATTDTSVSAFTSEEDTRHRPACSVADGRSAGAFGVLLAAFAARRRRA